MKSSRKGNEEIVKRLKRLTITIASITGLLFAAFTVPGAALPANAATAPTPAATYGCVVGSSRTLEYVYTVESNFISLLNGNGGECPSGFAVAIGKSEPANSPVPAAGPAYGCVENPNRTLEDVYTNEGNFSTFLSSNGGSCPNGGFAVNMGASGIPASGSVPAAGPAWGCVQSPNRTQQYIYTSESNYETFLTGSGGSCPNSGFEDGIGATYSCTSNITSAPVDFGQCGPYNDLSATGNQYVANDAWNAANGLATQKIQANSMADWQVNIMGSADNPELPSVITYPDASVTLGTMQPYTAYNNLTSSWEEVNTGVTSSQGWESAYDIWLGGAPGASGVQEIMVWTYNNNEGPAGQDTKLSWSDPTTGQTYEVWASAGNATVSLVPKTNLSSGSVNLLDMFQWLAQNNYLNTNPSTGQALGIYAIDYGWEVRTTAGETDTFTIDNYTLDAS